MITNEMMRTVIDTNLVGSLVHLQEASRLMARNRQGSVINVSSIIGRFGNDGQAVYAATKAAVIGMTPGLALSALWYLGKEHVTPIRTIREKLTPEAFAEFKAETPPMPAWMTNILLRYEKQTADA
jgi:NAD(P)-dependent dehydrogenase (short-subunit alcohol dehydrogenase family)